MQLVVAVLTGPLFLLARFSARTYSFWLSIMTHMQLPLRPLIIYNRFYIVNRALQIKSLTENQTVR